MEADADEEMNLSAITSEKEDEDKVNPPPVPADESRASRLAMEMREKHEASVRQRQTERVDFPQPQSTPTQMNSEEASKKKTQKLKKPADSFSGSDTVKHTNRKDIPKSVDVHQAGGTPPSSGIHPKSPSYDYLGSSSHRGNQPEPSWYQLDDENPDKIRVGIFKINGVVKHYAIVPPLKIRSQKDFEDLMNFWELDVPNFLIETNESNKERDKIITAENAPYILKGVFHEKIWDRTRDEDSATAANATETRGENVPVIISEPPIPENESTHDGAGPRPSILEIKRQPMARETTDITNVSIENISDRTTLTTVLQGEEHVDVKSWLNEKNLKWMKDVAPWLQKLKKKEIDENDWEFINKYLQRKVLRALSSIISAADMTNGWVFCHGAPSSNEKLLETAIETTGSCPTVLVVDDLDFYQSKSLLKDPARKHLSQLARKAVPLNRQKDEPVDLLQDAIDFNVNNTYDVKHRRGSVYAQKSIRSSRNKRTTSEDVSQDLWDVNNIHGWVALFPWTCGTHFIFSSDMEDFSPSLLGQAGYLCMNGHVSSPYVDTWQPRRTGYMIRESIQTIKPCILFDHTGSETQLYARLINKIKQIDEGLQAGDPAVMEEILGEYQKQGISTSVVLRDISTGNRPDDTKDIEDPTSEYYRHLMFVLRQRAWYLRDFANKGHTGAIGYLVPDHGDILNLADVVQIIDLYCENPRLFTKIVVPVDPLNDAPDDIVKTMTLSFARSLMESREVGAGDADKKAVEQAWRFHYQLHRTMCIKRYVRNLLYFLYILAGFLTTLVAVLNGQDVDANITQWVAMGLALVVSICAGILNLTGADSHLTKIHQAQAKIVFEIFCFRMRVGKYSLQANERARDGDDLGDAKRTQSSNISTAMHASRDRFARAIEIIMQELSTLDLYFQKEALRPQDGEKADVNAQNEFNNYVRRQLYQPNPTDKRNQVAVSGLMTPEDYYKVRVLPLLQDIEEEEDRLRMITRLLQISSMLCSSSAVILGAAGYVIPIPAVIAAATGFFQFLKVNDYERRFEISSAAARELRGLDAHWDSLSDLDHQIRSSIVYLVTTCEDLALQYATSSAIQVDKTNIGITDEVAAKPFKPSSRPSYGNV